MNTPARTEIRSDASRPAPAPARALPVPPVEREPPVTGRDGAEVEDDDRYDNMPCTD